MFDFIIIVNLKNLNLIFFLSDVILVRVNMTNIVCNILYLI